MSLVNSFWGFFKKKPSQTETPVSQPAQSVSQPVEKQEPIVFNIDNVRSEPVQPPKAEAPVIPMGTADSATLDKKPRRRKAEEKVKKPTSTTKPADPNRPAGWVDTMPVLPDQDTVPSRPRKSTRPPGTFDNMPVWTGPGSDAKGNRSGSPRKKK